jgi:acetyl esterase/lipase
MKKYNYSSELPTPNNVSNIKFNFITIMIMKALYNRKLKKALKYPIPDDLRFFPIKFSSYDGTLQRCFVIEPKASTGKRPAIIFCHGGAFFIPMQLLHLQNALCYAQALGCVILMPDYRLLPKHPFPIALEDCYSTLLYAAEQADLDKDRIILYGDSAGGCLAASLTHLTRDRKGPSVIGQMLIYPVIDHISNYLSIKEYKDGSWPASANRQMWEYYLRNGDQGLLQYASPLHGTDFSGLPRTYIEPSEMDCLCDEGLAYAEKLQANGVDTEVNIVKGAFHGFDEFRESPLVQRVLQKRCDVLKRMLDDV